MHNDLEKILFDEAQLAEMVERLGREITRDYAGEEIYAVGILKGAVLFYADLVRAIDLPVTLDFMQLSSYGGGTSSTGDVQILLDLAKSVAGRNILLIEDIVDSGLSMHYLMENFRHRKSTTAVRRCPTPSSSAMGWTTIKSTGICRISAS